MCMSRSIGPLRLFDIFLCDVASNRPSPVIRLHTHLREQTRHHQLFLSTLPDSPYHAKFPMLTTLPKHFIPLPLAYRNKHHGTCRLQCREKTSRSHRSTATSPGAPRHISQILSCVKGFCGRFWTTTHTYGAGALCMLSPFKHSTVGSVTEETCHACTRDPCRGMRWDRGPQGCLIRSTMDGCISKSEYHEG